MRLTKIIFFLLFFFILNNCQSFQETMTGAGKKKETDAFLVKKKDPLILPPNFEELPLPNSNKESKSGFIMPSFGHSRKYGTWIQDFGYYYKHHQNHQWQ